MKKNDFWEQKSPKWRCALRREKRRPAPARPIHAPVPCMFISTAHMHATHAKSAHAQCIAAHNTTCAHTAQFRALHAHTCCSHARTDMTNAPASRRPTHHTVAPQHALPTLPLLGSCGNDLSLPACSSCRYWCSLSNFMSKSPAVAVEDEHAIASRSAAARAPAPAADAAAPAQRSHARSEQRAAAPSPTL